MSGEKPILYSYWRSSCAQRVRTALNLKGIDYETRVIDVVTGEWPQEWLSLNPAKKIPVFVHNGIILTESLAIIEYIDEVFPGPAILPKDHALRAKARAIALHVTAGIQPLQVLRVQNKVNEERPGSGKEWAAFWITKGLGELEELVTKSAGKYCVGDEVTIADLTIPSILFNAKLYNVDVSKYPVLLRIDKELSVIPAFDKASAYKQADAPKQ